MTLQGAIKQLHELRCNEDVPVYLRPAIAEVINTLLMDTQEVRHGRWESVQYGCVCSVCGKRKEQFSDNFCAICGARMDGKEEENATN